MKVVDKIKMSSVSLFVLVFIVAYFSQFVLAANQTQQVPDWEASYAIKKSQNTINYMQHIGLNTERVNDLLESAKISFKLGDNNRVVEIGNEIAQLKETAILLRESINKTLLLIESAKSIELNAISIEEQLNLGIKEFEINNYEEAQIKVGKSLNDVKEILENELKNLLSILNSISNATISKNLELEIVNYLSEKIQKRLSSEDFSDINIIKKEILMLNTSVKNLLIAKNNIQEMADKKLTTSRVDDLYNEALLAIELSNLNRANDIAQEIMGLKEKAFAILNKINEAEKIIEDVESQGLDTSEAENLLDQGINKFNINDYEEANTLLQDSIKKAERIKASSLMFGVINKSQLKFNMIIFLKAYWWLISIILLILIIFGSTLYDVLYIRMLNNKISSLKKEQQTILNMIKQYQEDYFKKKKLSKESYDVAIDKYQERMLKIKETIPVLESKLKNKEKKNKFGFFRNFNKLKPIKLKQKQDKVQI
jgi:hypothetical protein